MNPAKKKSTKSPLNKKRGPYKLYNTFGSKKKIPRSTLNDWKRKQYQDTLKKNDTASLDCVLRKLKKVIESNDNYIQPRAVDLQKCQRDAGNNLVPEEVANPEQSDEHITNQGLEIGSYQPPTNKSDRIPVDCLINNLLVMCIKWKRNTSFTTSLDVLQAINISTTTPEINSSKYFWKLIIDKYSEKVSKHYICINCGNYLGSTTDKYQCHKCSWKIDYKLDHGYFLYLSLEYQLREVFESTDAHNLYSQNRKKLCKFAIEDIYDGKFYKTIFSNKENTISINFSIDGVPIFKSSNSSVYPVLCTINELDPVERRNRILLSSIWFGSGKPKDMNEYLKPFIAEAQKLYTNGLTYTYNGQEYNKKVVVLMGICDAVARPLVRCCTQFNGKYGCGLCLHPGKRVEKGQGHARVYPVTNNNAYGEGLRSHEQTIKHAEETLKENKKGIKQKSILMNLPHFNNINGLDVEWMHSVGLGVARQFANLWFDKANSNEKFYFGRILDEIDNHLTSLLPTSDFSRTPRPLTDRAHFKAHEWVAFLLAYSLPILKVHFPKKYVYHWALLVDGVSILVKESILPSEIVYAHHCLLEFVTEVETLYGEKYVSYNVHQLTHLAKSVENWGPLRTHSAFIYEDYYQIIQAHVQSANGVSAQISDSFRLKCAIDRLVIECEKDLSDEKKSFIADLLGRKTKPKSHFRIGNSCILDTPIIIPKLSKTYYLAVRRSGLTLDGDATFFIYNRCIIDKKVVTAKYYKREKKRANYYVLLNDGEIFEIQEFLGIKTGKDEFGFAIGYYWELTDKPLIRHRKLKHLIPLKGKIEGLEAVKIESIRNKVMVSKMIEPEVYVAYVHLCDFELLV